MIAVATLTVLLTVSPTVAWAPATAAIQITVTGEGAAKDRQMCLHFVLDSEPSMATVSCWPYAGYIQTRTQLKGIPAGTHYFYATLEVGGGKKVTSAQAAIQVLK